MVKERMHLVPQIVIDCAEQMSLSEMHGKRENFKNRLEAIRDFCDSVLRAESHDRKNSKRAQR